MTIFKKLAAAATITVMTAIPAIGQQAFMPYGTPISLEQAKKVIAAAEAEAIPFSNRVRCVNSFVELPVRGRSCAGGRGYRGAA
jgi:hypothetical protein